MTDHLAPAAGSPELVPLEHYRRGVEALREAAVDLQNAADDFAGAVAKALRIEAGFLNDRAEELEDHAAVSEENDRIYIPSAELIDHRSGGDAGTADRNG